MKGTANCSGTDIDLFISLSPSVTETLKQIYESLFTKLSRSGYAPKRQNVSMNINVSGYSVDLVPGKHQGGWGTDHSLYRRRAGTWTKTNIVTHITHVRQYARLRESRIVKLWRDQKRIDFPSFYLELTVIDALPWQLAPETLAANVWRVFQYLRDNVTTSRVIDPANTNNIISDDLTAVDKGKVQAAAVAALSAKAWEQIVT